MRFDRGETASLVWHGEGLLDARLSGPRSGKSGGSSEASVVVISVAGIVLLFFFILALVSFVLRRLGSDVGRALDRAVAGLGLRGEGHAARGRRYRGVYRGAEITLAATPGAAPGIDQLTLQLPVSPTTKALRLGPKRSVAALASAMGQSPLALGDGLAALEAFGDARLARSLLDSPASSAFVRAEVGARGADETSVVIGDGVLEIRVDGPLARSLDGARLRGLLEAALAIAAVCTRSA